MSRDIQGESLMGGSNMEEQITEKKAQNGGKGERIISRITSGKTATAPMEPSEGPLRAEVKAFIAVVVLMAVLALEPWTTLLKMKPWYTVPDPVESNTFWKISIHPVLSGFEFSVGQSFGRRRSMPMARKKACIANMRTVEGAIEMYDMDSTGSWPKVDKMSLSADSELGAVLTEKKYLKSLPICKSGGNYSVLNFPDATEMECTYHGTVNQPKEVDHMVALGPYTRLPVGSGGLVLDFFNALSIWIIAAIHVTAGALPYRCSKDPLGAIRKLPLLLLSRALFPLFGFFLLLTMSHRCIPAGSIPFPGPLARGLLTPLRKIATGLAVTISGLLLLGPGSVMFALPYTAWVILRNAGRAQRACMAAGNGWRNPWFGRAFISVLVVLFGVFLFFIAPALLNNSGNRLKEIGAAQIAFWTIGTLACSFAAVSRVRAQAILQQGAVPPAGTESAEPPAGQGQSDYSQARTESPPRRKLFNFESGDAMIVCLAGILMLIMRTEMYRNRDTVFFNSIVLLAGLVGIAWKAFQASSAFTSRSWSRLATDSLGCIALAALFAHTGYALGFSETWKSQSFWLIAAVVAHYFFWSIRSFRDLELRVLT